MAVTQAIGSERVGLRLSPLNSFNSMKDSDPLALIGFLADRLNVFKLAYLHVMRADFFGVQKADVMPVAREKRSEEHTSELQSLMRISYAVFCLKKKKRKN